MTTHYRRRHHQLIASCLENFNTDYLARHNILFGGGTRIALELDEYRESVDIDFLCPDINAYRAVRQQVTNTSLGELVRLPFNYSREIRFDRYGVRTFINAAGVNIKLEFVAFDHYQLSATLGEQLFPVPYIDQTSCFITKLLANADRVALKPYKDIFDLVVMFSHWGHIPETAFAEAYRHYSQSVVQQGLTRALQHWFVNETDYASAAKDMAIEPAYYSNVILPAARRLAQSGEC